MVPHARLGGPDGMKVSRAAFAVMVKFSDLYDHFSQVTDELDLLWDDLKDDPERDIKIKEQLKQHAHYDQILKRWESASKMRLWIQEKKKNLAEKIKKQVEAKFIKEKDEKKEE